MRDARLGKVHNSRPGVEYEMSGADETRAKFIR
jgi:hypothetical protein